MEKTKEEFLDDIEIIYELLTSKTKEISKYLNYKEEGVRIKLEDYLNKLEIRVCDESTLAISTRLVHGRIESLTQFLKNEGANEDKINEIDSKSYEFVKEFYEEVFDNMLNKIKEKSLLTDFYRELLVQSNKIGKKFNKFHPARKKHIIFKINNELKEKYKEDSKVLSFLRENNLIEKGHLNLEADRTYSTLIKEGDSYKSASYFEAFEEVKEIVESLSEAKDALSKLSDDTFDLDSKYQDYFQAIIDAFTEEDLDNLVSKWCNVDKAWMKITSPIQIVHPLEYYDDHFRKSIQPEWDVRIINPKIINKRAESVKSMYKELFEELGDGKEDVYQMCIDNIDRTQLYLGRPLFYYGDHLEGTFSAQVVPNDMVASKELGKKIFAFADKVLENSRNKPFFMKLPKIIYEEDTIRQARQFLYNETEKWHEVYDITTIGHEYGHILWLDDDTEVIMNTTGNFKNIEEFKATSGGVVSFLKSEKEDIKEEVVKDLLSRAVSLIAWMRVPEVVPYYCEGLIHLKGLFDTKVISWEGPGTKLKENITEETYQDLKNWYLCTYKELAKTYLEKRDATEFLNKFAVKDEKYFMPVDKNIKEFVEYFYKNYEEYANQIDETDSPDNYRPKTS